MSADELTKLFSYMTKRFDSIDEQLSQKADKTEIEQIITILDGNAKRLEIVEDELAVIRYQLDR